MENSGLLSRILIPGSQYVRGVVGLAPKHYLFVKKRQLILEAKFDAGYELSINCGLVQWSHQLIDVQSCSPKLPKRQFYTLTHVVLDFIGTFYQVQNLKLIVICCPHAVQFKTLKNHPCCYSLWRGQISWRCAPLVPNPHPSSWVSYANSLTFVMEPLWLSLHVPIREEKQTRPHIQ